MFRKSSPNHEILPQLFAFIPQNHVLSVGHSPTRRPDVMSRSLLATCEWNQVLHKQNSRRAERGSLVSRCHMIKGKWHRYLARVRLSFCLQITVEFGNKPQEGVSRVQQCNTVYRPLLIQGLTIHCTLSPSHFAAQIAVHLLTVRWNSTPNYFFRMFILHLSFSHYLFRTFMISSSLTWMVPTCTRNE